MLEHTTPAPKSATNPHLQVPPEYGEILLTLSHIELVAELHVVDELGLQMHSVPPLQTGFRSVQPVCGSEDDVAQKEQVPSAWHLSFEFAQVPFVLPSPGNPSVFVH